MPVHVSARRAPVCRRTALPRLASVSVTAFLPARRYASADTITIIMAPRLSVTETVNTFKNRLDKFWSDQEVLCCKIDLHGIGNRSIV